jgi:hypothetical protein
VWLEELGKLRKFIHLIGRAPHIYIYIHDFPTVLLLVRLSFHVAQKEKDYKKSTKDFLANIFQQKNGICYSQSGFRI